MLPPESSFISWELRLYFTLLSRRTFLCIFGVCARVISCLYTIIETFVMKNCCEKNGAVDFLEDYRTMGDVGGDVHIAGFRDNVLLAVDVNFDFSVQLIIVSLLCAEEK